MIFQPIIAALRHHKSGVVLISLQIALTLAIVCNAMFVVGQRLERLYRPTGIEEKGLLLVTQQWVDSLSTDPASVEKTDAMELADLDALRRIPDVVSASAVSALPLTNKTWIGDISIKRGATQNLHQVAYYFGDSEMLKTLGLRLVQGRAFTENDIQHGYRSGQAPPVIMVTRSLANKLFPAGNALGKIAYLDALNPAIIVGIVDRLQTPSYESGDDAFAFDSVIQPVRLDVYFSRYAIRTLPGREQAVRNRIKSALYAVNPMRVIDPRDGIQTFTEIRRQAYSGDLGVALLMSLISAILLLVTGAGILGLTSFWVTERYAQIGIRRALGARRSDIFKYFQAENLLIAGLGIVAGAVLAISLNLWLMRHYELPRLPMAYVVASVLAMLFLGQIAVFIPSTRASRITPIAATRLG